MADIFLSYSKKDVDRVQPVLVYLESRNYTVWWDKGIIPGDSWAERIELELESAAAVVVVWSQYSVTSEWVEIEAGKAKSKKKYVPIIIDDVISQVPLEFSRIEVANMIGFDEFPENCETELLIAGIEKAKNKEATNTDENTFTKGKKRSLWDRWKTKISIAATAAGIVLIAINIGAVIKPSTPAVENARNSLVDFSVMYLSYEESSGTFGVAPEDSTDARVKTYLGYPKIETEIESLRDTLTLGIFDSIPTRVTYLLIENNGKETAKEVRLQVERLFVNDTVLVNEAISKTIGDYAAQLKRKAVRSFADTINLPLTIAPGQGVLVPLFEAIRLKKGWSAWVCTSRNISIPLKIFYKTAGSETERQMEVRKMTSPVMFRGGVEGRG